MQGQEVFNPIGIMNSAAAYPLSAAIPAAPMPGGPGLSWPQPESFTNPMTGGSQDTFRRVTEGSIQPIPTDPSYVVPVEVADSGAIIQKTLAGPEVVGQLEPQGNFSLVTGQSGNIFRDNTLSVQYQHNDNPFVSALRATEQQRATLGSEVPSIRAQITRLGLDGRGIKIGILDAYENIAGDQGNPEAETADNPSGWRLHDHSYAVGSVINDPDWGVAPGAQVIDTGFRMAEDPVTDRDNPQLYMENKLKSYSRIYDDTTRQIYGIMGQADPSLRVLSLTWGSSRVKMYVDALTELNEKDEQGNYKRPIIRDMVLGNARYGSLDDKIQAVIRFVDNLCNSPAVQQAHGRYIEGTRQLAARGITLCVAAGNDHGMMDSTAQFPPGAEFNDLAKSPYVIAVAASDTNQTPGYRQDDRIAAFSSRGDGQLWNPTIAAPGQEVRANRVYGAIGYNMVINGTSYATPYTAGVVGMMVQKNPMLGFEQIKALLQSTATPLSSTTVADSGAGALNPEQTVLSA
ncbi:MAG TPA: S8 family serine peptidase [Coleofasciculaceae cyanobacterium]